MLLLDCCVGKIQALCCCRATNVEAFDALQQPIHISYDEFEMLLLVMANDLYEQKKRPGPNFEEFLGGFMDQLYRTSGVLVDYPQD